MNIYLINDTQVRFEERLQEAEERRLAKLASATRISRLDQVRVELGERLIALGSYLKAPARHATQLD